MSDDTTPETVDDDLAEGDGDLQQSNLAKVVAPLAAIVVTEVVRRVLDGGYRRVTGSAPPRASDRNAPMRQVLLWAAATAAAVAVASVVVDRLTAPRPPA